MYEQLNAIYCVNLVAFRPQHVFVSIILKPTDSRKMLTDKQPSMWFLR